MRKTFHLNIEGKQRDRLLDAARHDIHRYLKRERRRPVPVGADFWDFDCRFGTTEEDARTVDLAAIKGLIAAVAAQGDAQFYVELAARPGQRAAAVAAAQGNEARRGDARGSDAGGD